MRKIACSKRGTTDLLELIQKQEPVILDLGEIVDNTLWRYIRLAYCAIKETFCVLGKNVFWYNESTVTKINLTKQHSKQRIPNLSTKRKYFILKYCLQGQLWMERV